VEYISFWLLGGKVTLAWQVEKHRFAITNNFKTRGPLNFGVAPNAVTVFYFKQGDSGALVITQRVEVFFRPPMLWPSIQHISNESLIAEQFKQVLLLLLLCRAFRIRQKVLNDLGEYFIVSRFWFSDGNSWLRDRIRGLRLRYRVKSFNVSDGIRRKC
jgi:hypothetical protein